MPCSLVGTWFLLVTVSFNAHPRIITFSMLKKLLELSLFVSCFSPHVTILGRKNSFKEQLQLLAVGYKWHLLLTPLSCGP
jgi:hypothetical protein